MTRTNKPGSTKRLIVRAALQSGAGMAICNCSNDNLPSIRHDSNCPVFVTGRVMKEIICRNLKRRS
jgi:hypothetical protein